MDYAMRRPWWAAMTDDATRRGGHGGHRPPWEAFGPGGPFGPRGAFGPEGPFGPSGRPYRGRGGRARRGDVRQAILALLAESPLNGYQIIQTLAERTGGLWRPSPGAVYPALSQLEDEALIEQFDKDGQRAFRLTDAGREAARDADRPWETVNQANAPRDPDAAADLWREFADVAMAAKTVARSGNAAQVTKAADLLAEARRRLYGVLADDAPDLANPDDLR